MRVFYVLMIVFAALSIELAQAEVAFPERVLDLQDYDLSIRIRFEYTGYEIARNTMTGAARITLKNGGPREISNVPLLLHRLMKVTAVTDAAGSALQYSQSVRAFQDNDTYQVNYVQISLQKALQPADTILLSINYAGHLSGYTETGMLYVKERLDPAFTILRSETFCYPQVLYPVESQLRESWNDRFHQKLHITVPAGYVAVNAGIPEVETGKDGFLTYHFRSKDPRSLIIVPIAKYEEAKASGNRIYFLPEDRQGAALVAEKMQQSFELLQSWLGPLSETGGIVLVEIPDEFGSQADFPLIIQTATAFQDPGGMGEVYHELTHLWNPRELETTPPRWNEGLAMFLQGLISERLGEKNGRGKLTEQLFTSFQKRLNENKSAQSVPMKDYGQKDLTSLSYTGGAIFFALSYDICGEEKFLEILRSFHTRYSVSGAGVDAFMKHFADSGIPQMKRLVQDWFATADYAPMVLSATSYSELTARYSR